MYETIPVPTKITANTIYPTNKIIFLPYLLENTPEAKAKIIKTNPETTVIMLAKDLDPKVSLNISLE